MKRGCRVVFSLFTLFAGGAAQAGYMRSYAYEWPLTLNGDSAAWQIEPSAEVYTAITDAQLRDLEVVDGEGNPVPMAPRAPETATAPSTWTELPLFALPVRNDNGKSDDGAINLRIERDGRLRSIDTGVKANKPAAQTTDFIVDASNLVIPIESLRLDWTQGADPISAEFAIAASSDLQTWRSLVENASVIGLTQAGNRLSRHEIAIGSRNRIAYLRLHRLDGGDALDGLRISARTIAVSTALQAGRQWLTPGPQLGDAVADKAPAGAAIYRYGLPAALPTEALKLELGSDNSIANVRIESRSGEADAWLPRASFTAFRLHQNNSLIVNDEVAVTAISRDTQWRVQVSPAPDRAPNFSVAWHADRFVFLAQGHGPYRLIAGSASARRGDYPVDIALAQLRGKLGKDWQPPLAQLGARDTLSGAEALKAPTPPETPRDWKTWLLWAVLVGAAGLIGYLAMSLLRGPKT